MRRGSTVLVALDGQSALETFQIRWREIDAVLLDIGLPKIPGWEVMRRMKEISFGQDHRRQRQHRARAKG
jgi:DNA-binding response OmpR family regulator